MSAAKGYLMVGGFADGRREILEPGRRSLRVAQLHESVSSADIWREDEITPIVVMTYELQYFRVEGGYSVSVLVPEGQTAGRTLDLLISKYPYPARGAR